MALRAADTENGDMKVADGDLVLVTHVDAMALNLENRLRLLLSEWFLSPDSGVDWLDMLQSKPVDTDRVEEVLTLELAKEEKVMDVVQMRATFDNQSRELSVSFVVETTEGTTSGGFNT